MNKQNSGIQSQYSEINVIFVHQQRETGKKIPFTVATGKIKYLGINLTKEVKDLYSENYRTLNKEIKIDTNKWKHILCSWIGRINIMKMSILAGPSAVVPTIKMSILPKAIYRFNKFLLKYQWHMSQILNKYFKNLKPKKEPKKTPNSLRNREKEEQSRRDHNT